MLFHQIFMNVCNITNINSIIINRKIVHISIPSGYSIHSIQLLLENRFITDFKKSWTFPISVHYSIRFFSCYHVINCLKYFAETIDIVLFLKLVLWMDRFCWHAENCCLHCNANLNILSWSSNIYIYREREREKERENI